MSKTNAQVREAFSAGKSASNSRGSLESFQPIGPDGFTMLQSYRTTIAIRRDSDGQEFYDAHHYSPTTTQHQAGHYGDPSFSFDCVAELMGGRWFEAARILDWGPRDCTNPECEAERQAQHDQYNEGLREWQDNMFSQCFGPDDQHGDPQDRHKLVLPSYTNGHWGQTAAVLLGFGNQGQVLCGFEVGKAVKWSGRTDQLWAALLPFRVYDIGQAFEALKPSYVRNAERHNKLAAEAGQLPEPRTPADGPAVAIHRQGDLYFVECPNGQGPPKEAFKMDGVTLPPGERANHRASQVRVLVGPEGTHSIDDSSWRIWARGQVLHAEHPRLCLGKVWHRVLQSAAVRAASSAYRHGGTRGVYGD